MDTGGVILNPQIPLLLPASASEESLPDDALVRAVRHVVVLTSVDERGLALFTSKGLGVFGLPEIEARDAPRNLSGVNQLVNGMAQKLLDAVAPAAEAPDGAAKFLELGPDMRLSVEDVERAYARPGGAVTAQNARGWTSIRVEYRPSRRRGAYLRLLPPDSFRGDQGVWLNSALGDLFGTAGRWSTSSRRTSAWRLCTGGRWRSCRPFASVFGRGFRWGPCCTLSTGSTPPPAAGSTCGWWCGPGRATAFRDNLRAIPGIVGTYVPGRQ